MKKKIPHLSSTASGPESFLLTDSMKHYVRQNNCFDLLRYFFALLIVASHFSVLVNSEYSERIAQTGPIRVKAFFIITGFLVTYSYLRNEHDLRKYLRKRFMRILPAYVVAVILGFIVCMTLTSYSVIDFLSTVESWKYLGANLLMLNWLQPSLPGVFESCQMTAVNGSLWTMKFEVIFYLLLPLFIRGLRTSAGYYILGALVIATFYIYPRAPLQLQYFYFFLSGVAILFSLDWLAHGHRFRNAFLLSVIVEMLLYIPDYDGMLYVYDALRTLEIITFPLILIFVAYNLPIPKALSSLPNVTYGIYLYHFPVVQVIVQTGLFRGNVVLMFIATYVITGIMATLSYLLIERRYMRRRVVK